MLSEETLKKYFEAIFPYASKYKPNGEQRYWKRFLENKNILDEEVEKIQEKAWDDGWESNYHRG